MTLSIENFKNLLWHKEGFPVAIPAEVGMVVVTQHGYDIGLVAKVSLGGHAEKVYAMYDVLYTLYVGRDEFPEYSTPLGIIWFDTGVRMTKDEWKQLSVELGDACSFHKYWEKKLGLKRLIKRGLL